QSYGASGDQSRAVAAGQKADILHLALEPDVTRLVPSLVAPSWNDNRYRGAVANSVVVLVVRKGNPKHIKDWGDLVKPGVTVVTADPISSGGARWNALAAYGAALRENDHDTQAAFNYLKAFFQHAPTRPSSARDALTLFSKGYGDVLVTYESEAIYANNHGEDDDYVIPKDTILIQTVLALPKGASKAARDFAKFLYTPAAQQEFAKVGFRSVIPSLVDKKAYPKPAGLFTINNFGGWATVVPQFFTPKTGLIAKAEAG
ncbi:MAG TPA: sulfate ABC transporter substrate-binding protein, partial [Solirubrobacteraceae bacterium]|nr:sulfate ABC transporter substrate-binding protein [Solirubrobacteraceae bacterium]